MAKPKNPVKGYEKFFNKFFERDFKDISKALQGLGLKPAKMVEIVVDRLRKIENVDKAFHMTLAYSSANTFYNALVKHEFELPDHQSPIEKFRDDLLRVFERANYKVEEFDIEKFSSNEPVQKVERLYYDWLKVMDFEELDIRKVQAHFTDYFKIDFYEFLEESKSKYERLTSFLDSDSYKERIKLYRREMYYSRLASMYLEPVLNDEKGVSLKDLYVEPKFRIYRKTEDEAKLRKDMLKDGLVLGNWRGFNEVGVNSSYNLHHYINNLFLNKDLYELGYEQVRMFFVLGYPGQGKSSFCKRLMYDWINDENLPLNQRLYFIKLREVSSSSDLLNHPLDTLLKEASIQIKEDIDKYKFYESWLILDGLDELKMNAGLETREIDEFCSKLVEETAKHDKLKIVVTSRSGYITVLKTW